MGHGIRSFLSLLLIAGMIFINPGIMKAEDNPGSESAATQSVGANQDNSAQNNTQQATQDSVQKSVPTQTDTAANAEAGTTSAEKTPAASSADGETQNVPASSAATTPVPAVESPAATPMPEIIAAPIAEEPPFDTSGLNNLALHKQFSGSILLKNWQNITDGLTADPNNFGSMDVGAQWIMLDLGQSCDISAIRLWHYFGNPRAYKDVIVQLSNDPGFQSGVTTVFNNDADNSSGQGLGGDPEYQESKSGKGIRFAQQNARYVRLWSNGSSANPWNHYVEVEVYGVAQEIPVIPETTNIALNTGITASDRMSNQAFINDGNIDSGSFAGLDSGLQWIVIDLGANYDISRIKLWHYYLDNRRYKDVIIQISGDPDFTFTKKTVFNNDTDNSAGEGAGSDAEYAETGDGKDLIFSAVKGRYLRIWSNGSSANPWNHYVEVKVFGDKVYDDPYVINNAALKKSVTSNTELLKPALIVDGLSKADDYASLAGEGLQYIRIDLKQSYSLNKIILWHYYKDRRTYKDVVVQISDDPSFTQNVNTVFNNDNDNSAGMGSGTDQEYYESDRGKEIIFSACTGRYIRLWSNGSTIGPWNHYVEVQAYGDPVGNPPVNSANLALQKSLASGVSLDNPDLAVDGVVDSSSFTEASSGLQWLQLDLGESKVMRHIKLWHYFGDGRTYKDVIVQISDDPEFQTGVMKVFNNDTDGSAGRGIGDDLEYTESSAGKDIVFEAIKGRYIRFWSCGSSANSYNHYAEIQIFKKIQTSAPIKIPVLMYHSVCDNPEDIYQIATSRFDEEMKYLKDNGFTSLSMNDYINIMKKNKTMPSKPVLITFDDGWLDNYTVAIPILEKYGLKATFFIVSNFIDAPDRISMQQLLDMKKKGFDIGGHSLNHERLTDYNYNEQKAVLSEAKTKLDNILKTSVKSFAYPYGQLNTDTVNILGQLDYKISFSSYEGHSSKTDNAYTVKRLFINGEYTVDDFKEILSNPK